MKTPLSLFFLTLLFNQLSCMQSSLYLKNNNVSFSPIMRGYIRQTFAMIKPDSIARENCPEAIKAIIGMNNLNIIAEKKLLLSREQAQALYQEHSGCEYFQRLIDFITSGPVILMVLEGPFAGMKWRNLMGPSKPHEYQEDTIRAIFGTDQLHNAVHGADSANAAQREIKLFFS